ncbi:MAG TPA: hypothetical protein VHZ76_09655 [Gammaproteobacteria bacterium]|nr:hypothetical protein [Gammaproteobacteria bacterium]
MALERINEKQCAEAILKFTTEIACPYGAVNTDEGQIARKKILEVRKGQDKSLDWNNLSAQDVKPWKDNELEGVKSVISAELMSQDPSQKHKKMEIGDFNAVKDLAEFCIRYASGRCAGLAAIGLIRSIEIAPHIFTMPVHFYKTNHPNEYHEVHALLLIGVIRNGSQFVPTMNTYFCDPWKKKMGTIKEYINHITSLGYSLQNILAAPQWISDDPFLASQNLTDKWLAEPARQEIIKKIEDTFILFQKRNEELKAMNFNQTVKYLNTITGYKAFGFWQKQKEFIAGARITCNTDEERKKLETLLRQASINFKIEENPDNTNSSIIIDDINDPENARRINQISRS